jgi:hypothetical protein
LIVFRVETPHRSTRLLRPYIGQRRNRVRAERDRARARLTRSVASSTCPAMVMTTILTCVAKTKSRKSPRAKKFDRVYRSITAQAASHHPRSLTARCARSIISKVISPLSPRSCSHRGSN